MLDRFNRKISYLRISVTDRCDLRCLYCMPAEGVDWVEHSRVISFEEIVETVKVAVSLGVEKIRLTGGEPLVRKGIVDLVRMIARTPGVKDLAMTTNGQQLEKYAADLAKAGNFGAAKVLHAADANLVAENIMAYSKVLIETAESQNASVVVSAKSALADARGRILCVEEKCLLRPPCASLRLSNNPKGLFPSKKPPSKRTVRSSPLYSTPNPTLLLG